MADSNSIVKADHMLGRAYGRPAASYDEELAKTGPGTLGGELLRRYWQPFALSSELTDELPVAVRILGEDLIAFRDKSGIPGLVYPRCMHRGASLLFGKIEAEGIRCPYHGWLYDSEGHLLDTPCEINANSRLGKTVRQPWYPVIEKYGLVFTYMGPADKQPEFPRVPAVFENLAEDECLVNTGGMKPAAGPQAIVAGAMDFNWWAYFENFMDPLHVGALHRSINGIQFLEHISDVPSPVKWKKLADGTGVTWIGHWQSDPDGPVTQEIMQVVMPNMILCGPVFLPGPAKVEWCVPVDDTNHRLFGVVREKKGSNRFFEMVGKLGLFQPDWGPGKPYQEWTLEDHQRWQTDYTVQKSQGSINLHSDEHLTTADTGVVLTRRLFKQQAELVSQGKDPIGSRPGEAQVVNVIAGTGLLDGKTHDLIEGFAHQRVSDY